MVSKFVSRLKGVFNQEPLPAAAQFFAVDLTLGVNRKSEGRYPVWFILGNTHRMIGNLQYANNGDVSYVPSRSSNDIFRQYGIEIAKQHGIPVRYS